MKAVKTYEDFLKEPSSSAKQTPSKQVVSERCWEALKECYEMAKNEMTAYHKSEKKEEVAEAYMAEFAKCNEAMMNELVKECESIMAGPAQPGQA